MSDRDRDANHDFFKLVLAIVAAFVISAVAIWGVIVIMLMASHGAHARDYGQYAGVDPKIHAWFETLASSKGPCCSKSDGVTVEDVDWTVQHEGQECQKVESDGDYQGSYCVRLAGEWWLVPERAVVTEPNRFGPAVVWPVWATLAVDGVQTQVLHDIRCFLPGAGA